MKRPTYTPSSIIKKIFRPGERSLSREEIVGRLRDYLTEIGNHQEAEQYLAEVLALPVSPVRIGRTEAIVELAFTTDQLFNHAYRILRETNRPRTTEQIVRELRKQTRFSWNQIARTLQLEKDPRFVQFIGDERWFLAEWELANDLVYEAACSRSIHSMSIRMVRFFMEEEIGLSERDFVFLPRLDDRFRVVDDTLFINLPEGGAELEQTALPLADDEVPTDHAGTTEIQAEEWEQAASQVAAATQTTNIEGSMKAEEELTMSTVEVQHVHAEVDRLLTQAVTLLEERNREMAEEVVAHFQQSNMTAIEMLLHEKQQNEQAVQELKRIMANLTQK